MSKSLRQFQLQRAETHRRENNIQLIIEQLERDFIPRVSCKKRRYTFT